MDSKHKVRARTCYGRNEEGILAKIKRRKDVIFKRAMATDVLTRTSWIGSCCIDNQPVCLFDVLCKILNLPPVLFRQLNVHSLQLLNGHTSLFKLWLQIVLAVFHGENVILVSRVTGEGASI
jgi:hypothetical protein